MADVAHHAHDLKLFVLGTVVLDELADRIFAAENVPGGLLVNYRDARRVFRVVLVEIAAADERDSHRFEIIRRRDPDIGRICFLAAGPIKSAGTVPTGKWKAADGRDAFDAGHAGNALHDLLIKLELRVLVRPGGC